MYDVLLYGKQDMQNGASGAPGLFVASNVVEG